MDLGESGLNGQTGSLMAGWPHRHLILCYIYVFGVVESLPLGLYLQLGVIMDTLKQQPHSPILNVS